MVKKTYKQTAYSKKLLDPRWQKKRLEVLSRDNWTCQVCGNKKQTLHVHHKYYENGLEPWEYELDTLSTLCSVCHEEETLFIKEQTESLLMYVKSHRHYLFSDMFSVVEAMNCLQIHGDKKKYLKVLQWSFENNREVAEVLTKMYDEDKNKPKYFIENHPSQEIELNF